jgi:hypothetical protein
MKTIDFNAEASLYLGRDWRTALAQGSRRFPSAAKAIRFALEEAPPVSLHGARMIVDGRTYSPDDLQKFYGDRAYPLHRKAELEARLVEPFND